MSSLHRVSLDLFVFLSENGGLNSGSRLTLDGEKERDGTQTEVEEGRVGTRKGKEK